MSITIDENICVGCGKCTEVCPGNLIRLTESLRARNLYPEECWGCCSCVKECAAGAIRFYLGADIGGRGATLRVRDRGDTADWIIEKDGAVSQVITLCKKDANQY